MTSHRRALPPIFVDADPRTVLANERRSLSRLANRRREHDAAEARLALAAARRIADEQPTVNTTDIAASLAQMLRAVAASWGLDLRFSITLDGVTPSVMVASNRVRICHPHACFTTDSGDLSIDRVRAVAAAVKGTGYHEVGHILHTVPFTAILGYIRRTRHIDDDTAATVARARAILEDQRMEARMVLDSPTLGGHFAASVMRHLAHLAAARPDEPDPGDWLLVAGRAHVPEHIRWAMRGAFVERFGAHHADAAESLIDAYRSATTPREVWRIAAEFAEYVEGTIGIDLPDTGLGDELPARRQSAPGSDADNGRQGESRNVGDLTRRLAASATPHRTDQPDATPPVDPSSDGSGPAGRTTQQPNDDETTGTGHDGADDVTPQSLDDRLAHALRTVEQQLLDDPGIDDAVARIVEVFNADAPMLPRPRPSHDQTAAGIRDAEFAAQQMVEALRVCTAENAPTWQGGQQRGVLDPFAFRTRTAGNRDFFRASVGNGDLGIDLALSLVLDVSGSMQHHQAHLGAAAFACKYACDELSIPCTVTLFSSSGFLLWDVDDAPTHLQPVAAGTTNPSEACAALDQQRHDRSLHLVLMFTDGAFDSSFEGLERYWAHDRAIVLVGLGTDVTRCHATTRGVHELLTIRSVLDLPTVVTNVLAPLV